MFDPIFILSRERSEWDSYLVLVGTKFLELVRTKFLEVLVGTKFLELVRFSYANPRL